MSSSGNSVLSWASASPMLIRARDAADDLTSARSELAGNVAGEVDEPELADLDLVAVGQHGLVDPVAVDVGAVEAADVGDGEAVRRAPELDVAPGDGDVVEEDLALGVATCGHHVLVEQEPVAGPRPALHHEQRAATRERVDGRGVVVVEGRPLLLLQ